MEMSGATLVGLIAAVLTTFAFVPQVIRAWRTRSTRDISLVTFIAFTVGIVLWLTYGALIRDLPLLAANAVSLLFAATILYFKLRYG
jgi:MtN3 and saliva related transmembrane protein